MKKNLFLSFCCIICSLLLWLSLPFAPARAANTQSPTAVNNLNISLRKHSSLTAVKNGYLRVYHSGNTIGIEYYDTEFRLQSKKTIAMELAWWGGFYAGKDAYYLVEGQANKEESDTAEVIRVIKYDLNWKRIGAARITGAKDSFGKVRYPFDYGCVEMAEKNGTLYIATSHEGYVDEMYGQGHQGYLLIAVNTASMTGEIVKYDLWHSFAQYIKASDDDLYVLQQSEGSRCTTLTKYDADMNGKTLNVFSYGGSRTSAWAISCYASVDGMAVSSDNILCIGTSIDQSLYDSVTSATPHNIYLTVTPKADFTEDATEVKWLTNYTSAGKSFLGVTITKINDNRFLVTWEEYETEGTASDDDTLSSSVLHYLYLDGNGNKIGTEKTMAAPISDCAPIVSGSKVLYYASNENMLNFYSIDSSTGKTDKVSHRIAGANASWSYKNGVLTITGSGKVSIAENDTYRYPVSSTKSMFMTNTDSSWSAISKNVKKIVIGEGITEIDDNSFAEFENVTELSLPSTLKSIGVRAFAICSSLTEVTIPSGVTAISEKAFYGCDSLRKITIPSSVKTIGDDILWIGSYWVSDGSHVVYATIYAEPDSAALTYAKKNKISYRCSLKTAKISGLKNSYSYTGSAIRPSIKVTLGKDVLKEDEDYTVSYSNNTAIGKATVTITGYWHYEGELKKTFTISYPAKGKKLTDKETGIVYKVTKAGSTVALSSAKNLKVSRLTVPTKVTLNGVTYKVTSISDNAFLNNKKLKTVVIGNRITSVGRNAFSGCQNLRTITVGKNVKSIGTKAFYGCKKLTSITFKTTSLTSKNVGAKAFTYAGKTNYKKLVITVPAKNKAAYKKLFRKKGLTAKATVKA